MNTSTSLKEYYIKLEQLYVDAVNMLTAMQQSLSSNSSEITIDVNGTSYRIPSFMYIENKLEQFETNFSNLFNMPKNGEAWFNNSDNMYKLQLVKGVTTPITPNLNNDVYASITDNNILKDMVSPKTYLKINISNLPNNIDKVCMKKIIFHNTTIFNNISKAGLTSYEEVNAALYEYYKGADYDEYESVIDLPIKSSSYNAKFNIIEITELESGNPYTEIVDGKPILNYELVLNTVQYTNADDAAIIYTLKTGDYLSLTDDFAIYKVKHVNTANSTVIIEEISGHIRLQTTDENSNMEFSLYIKEFDEFKYVQVPLEENEYICVFISTLYNNVKSLYSAPQFVDLNNILMYDANGTKICDEYGNQMTYIEYYKKYCTNIGDLILGLTQSAYPQLSNFDNNTLNEIQNKDNIQTLVSNTINVEKTLQVVPINKHLTDDSESEDIISMHSQKTELNSQLKAIQNNIDQLYNTLATTDFSQEISITESSLRAQLQEYYTQRTSLQKQIITLVDSINLKISNTTKEPTKYRVRGLTDITNFETYIKTLGNGTLDIIGLEVEYKYKSVSKDTTSVTVINSNVFTDWNRLCNIDRQRYIKFSDNLKSWILEFVNYDTSNNIIKWNQIDIPISQNEDIIIRIRYKYNVGQPFVNIYSPWSDEITITFPEEYTDKPEIASILTTNEDDTVVAKFNNTLINDGYQEHVSNKLNVNNQTFFHLPENIYSGFNTADNNFMSLKDKLNEMTLTLDKYKEYMNNNLDQSYSVYLTYDNTSIELFNKIFNSIKLVSTDHIADTFIKKNMSIVIKNTGTIPVKLFSIFPGNTNSTLIENNQDCYDKTIGNYERVPIVVNNEATFQVMGQWIYFRQNNPHTMKDIYLNNAMQRQNEITAVTQQNDTQFISNPAEYLGVNNTQVLWAYKKRTEGATITYTNRWSKLDFSKFTDSINKAVIKLGSGDNDELEIYSKFKKLPKTWYQYNVTTTAGNAFIIRYEDIKAQKTNGKVVYLDNETKLSEFIYNYNNINYFNGDVNTFNGACFYPDIVSLNDIITDGTDTGYIEIPVGESVSIPIVFEYYLDGVVLNSIKKSLYFDIKDSVSKDPKHFFIDVTAVSDMTSTGDMINNVSLVDEATD